MRSHPMIERLLTWLDVERVFKQATALGEQPPKNVSAVRCFSDGADITYTGSADAVQDWLKMVFGRAYDAADCRVRLRIGDARYPLTLLATVASEMPNSVALPLYPLWQEMAYLRERKDEAEMTGLVTLPVPWFDAPRVVAFHSFKGGVGRTTSLMTYVAAQLEASKSGPVKLLVVDADLEAPGISFWLDEVNQPQVSFIQFLEAMHYPSVSVLSSLEHFATELQKTSLNVGGVQRELFVLPAALDLTEILDMPVQPEHLARNPANPWVLTDHVRALGRMLKVDAVFVDLRAGMSELASPLLFDPRVEHFFVTTVAAQSVCGMSKVLERLYAFNSLLPRQGLIEAKPSVILSMLTPQLRQLPDYVNALNLLGAAYPAAADQVMTNGVDWLEFDFSESLMSISNIRDAMALLKQSNLYAAAEEWVKPPLNIEVEQVSNALRGGTSASKTSALALAKLCQRVQFAEQEMSPTMLVTEPLRNLAKHFSTDLPNVVSVGAKGAGKTFTFLQVCNAKSWHSFMTKVGIAARTVADAAIFPVLCSENLEATALGAVKTTQRSCLDGLGRPDEPLPRDQVQRKIKYALSSPPAHWDDFWADLICLQFGLTDGRLSLLNDRLIDINQSVVLVFDGLEDAFDSPSDPAARDAIQSLLKLPNRLAELADRRIGAIVFVRADYVQIAIRQNVGQFMARFTPFQLNWNPESFLRLAYWLCGQAHIKDAEPAKAEQLLIQELLDWLEHLWGRKLGNSSSKEAHATRWVFAALCDLKGSFQARDLVRFLRFASELESTRTSSTWTDRVLAPESMRQSIPKCSLDKVKEASLEISFLRDWIARLDQAHVSERRVPFNAMAMLLSPEQLTALRDLGVIYEDTDREAGEDRLYLPEIYRAGLGFETSVAGRPRTMALLKKNLGTIPF